MLAYREWRVEYWRGDHPRPVLGSVVMRRAWRRAHVKADRRPTIDDDHGLYAILPDAEYEGRLLRAGDCAVVAEGAVDLHGRLLIHADGVVRAEKARILALRVMPCRTRNHCGYAYILDPYRLTPKRLAFAAYCDCVHGNPARHDVTLEELEEELLRAYGVPRLTRPAPIRVRRS